MQDDDLRQFTMEQLIEEVIKLRNGIREHRDSSGQQLCWHHPKLWNLLPEKTNPKIEVPDWPEFMKGCIRYRKSLDNQALNPEPQSPC
jgi:hypothetical protein